MKLVTLKARSQITLDVQHYCDKKIKKGSWTSTDAYCFITAMNDFISYVPDKWFGRTIDLDKFDGFIPPIFWEGNYLEV